MKVVGGPHDGLNVWVASDREVIQLVELLDGPPAWPYGEPMQIVGPTYRYVTYTVRKICGNYKPGNGADIPVSFDELKYLAPADWTDWQAIQHQFEK